MWLKAAIVTVVLGSVLTAEGQQAPSLKILVLAGEGAVNIIQQKTAVLPLVEVRDRNNLPVAGATVTFSIGGGGSGAAFAGGVQTLTVTTNAVGQAAASGLNALSSGTFQIQVQAAYQGQIATAAISQTNFATAAAAAQAGATVGGGGTTTGAAGGAAGGGGLSATTIAVVGAAIGGGALAATQFAKEEFDVYNGALTGQLIFTARATNSQGQQTTCDRSYVVTGSMTIELRAGNASGQTRTRVSLNEQSVTGPCNPGPPLSVSLDGPDFPVTGGPSTLTFTGSTSGSTTITVVFNGSLSGNTITGTVRISIVQADNIISGSGATTLQVTLQK